MRKIILLSLFVIFVSSNIFAAGTQTSLTKYTCTVKKMELYNGSEWITIFEGVKDMDIASVDLHAKVGEILQGLSLPVGTYTQCRMTLNGIFVVNGTVELGGTTYYTPGGSSSTNPAHIIGPAQDTTFIYDQGDYVQTVAANITIEAGATETARVIMSTGNVLSLNSHNGHIVSNRTGIEPMNYYFTLVEPSWTMEG